MKVESLACNNCGAPLEVAETTKFATCTHCGSRLSISRSGSAAYTEVLAQIGQHTEQMSDDLTAIRLHNDLERLDRDWQVKNEKWEARLTDLSKTVSEANKLDKGPAGPILGLIIGGIMLLSTMSSNGSSGAAIIPVGIIIWAFYALKRSRDRTLRHSNVKQHYQEQQQLYMGAEHEYNSKRADMVHRLDQA